MTKDIYFFRGVYHITPKKNKICTESKLYVFYQETVSLYSYKKNFRGSSFIVQMSPVPYHAYRGLMNLLYYV